MADRSEIHFDFDKCLRRSVSANDSTNRGEFFMGLESEFKGLISQISDKNKNDVDDDDDDDDKENVTIDDLSRKRKRECCLGILDWIKEVAKDPCDPAIGTLPERAKWKCYGAEEMWKQVLLAREAMLLKRSVDSSVQQSIWQIKQKMHPTMYEDHGGSERSRCSRRILSAKETRAILLHRKSQARACSESSSSATSDLEDHSDKPLDPLAAGIVGLWLNNHRRNRVPVGSHFQTKVPEWTGETCESDSKWLGTRVWPLGEKEPRNNLIERDRIGKGRQDSCGCQLPGSLECVRFHISEKRTRVKLELCSAFQSWGFDKMGEEAVALSWAVKEEKQFESIVKSNPPSLDKCFWDEIYKVFRSKSRRDLVSYYYNVFISQRRSYQNRYTPSNINSDDDDEPEALGHGAVKSPGSNLCSPRKVPLNFR